MARAVDLSEVVSEVRCREGENRILITTVSGSLEFTPKKFTFTGGPQTMNGLGQIIEELHDRPCALDCNPQLRSLDLLIYMGGLLPHRHTLGVLPQPLSDELRSAVWLSNARLRAWRE